MRLELQALQVENRKLREELQGRGHDPSKELELTQELISVREENIRLTKELDELTTLYANGRHIKTYQWDLSNFLHFMKNVFHSR